ncbi:MAG: RNA 2',3'-cyclic phosphodiesterase [bacterium]|nr:RNA 2',3'-cyclic phosphodiesterase [bacterium]
MRAFLAVHPGEEFRSALSTCLDPWRRRIPIRWTRPDAWHLTLQFLGEWPDERLQALQERLDGVAGPAPWSLRPAGLDAFPNLRQPRVLFLQLEDDGRIARLASLVRGAVADAWPDGPQDTKPLRPHLTVARVKDPLEQSQVNGLKDIDLDGLPPLAVTGFALVGSRLQPDGPRYRDVAFWRLRKKGE